jgi:hypothetical protein
VVASTEPTDNQRQHGGLAGWFWEKQACRLYDIARLSRRRPAHQFSEDKKMLKPIDIEQLAIPRLNLDDFGAPSADSHCSRCAAHRPGPQPDGNLRVDPEIHLPSPGMPVDIAWYYNSLSLYNGAYGFGRTISTNQTAQACMLAPSTTLFATMTLVTLTRGNGAPVTFLDVGVGVYASTSPSSITSLIMDTTDNYWKEMTLNGQVTAYPLNTSGMITSIAYIQDAVGNTQTFTYNANGLLQNLMDPIGRLVTFTYTSITMPGAAFAGVARPPKQIAMPAQPNPSAPPRTPVTPTPPPLAGTAGVGPDTPTKGELVHACGIIGHPAGCFSCTRAAFPSCKRYKYM